MAGAADWSEQDDAVRRLGALHAVANVAALSLYVGSLVARRKGNGTAGRVLAYSGLGVASASASIGGHMSYAQSSGANHSVVDARQLTTDWIDLGPLDDLPEGRPDAAHRRRAGRAGVRWPSCAAAPGWTPSSVPAPTSAGRWRRARSRRSGVPTAWSAPGTGRRSTWTTVSRGVGPTASAQERLEVRYEAGRAFGRLPDRHASK